MYGLQCISVFYKTFNVLVSTGCVRVSTIQFVHNPAHPSYLFHSYSEQGRTSFILSYIRIPLSKACASLFELVLSSSTRYPELDGKSQILYGILLSLCPTQKVRYSINIFSPNPK